MFQDHITVESGPKKNPLYSFLTIKSSGMQNQKKKSPLAINGDSAISGVPTDHDAAVCTDPEKQEETRIAEKSSAFKALGLLDRFLALWIFLAMTIGIILGNFVPSTGPSLQKGKFVGVSVPIG